MSLIGKRIAGTVVEDSQTGLPSVYEWVRSELRTGRLRKMVEDFVVRQPEYLDADLVQLIEIGPDRLICRIPCAVVDHESPHPFISEVDFDLDPGTGEASRR
jgi:hypothetical protein